MTDDLSQNEPNETNEPDTNDAWPIDDDPDVVDKVDDEALEDDEKEILLSTTASIDSQASAEAGESASSAAAAQADDTSDAAAIDTTDETTLSEPEDSSAFDPTRMVAKQTHRVAVELKKLELEVRRMLETVDNKRKRKLGGTRRWNELEDDIATWRHSGRHDEQTLCQLRELIYRRHYLFGELTNLASTRPVLNS